MEAATILNEAPALKRRDHFSRAQLRAIPQLMLVLARACEVGTAEFHRRRNDDVLTLVVEQEGL